MLNLTKQLKKQPAQWLPKSLQTANKHLQEPLEAAGATRGFSLIILKIGFKPPSLDGKRL